MTYILIILKVKVRLKKKVGLFCKKIIFLYYLRNTIYRCIVIFLGQCIDTFKSCIIPSLLHGLLKGASDKSGVTQKKKNTE